MKNRDEEIALLAPFIRSGVKVTFDEEGKLLFGWEFDKPVVRICVEEEWGSYSLGIEEVRKWK